MTSGARPRVLRLLAVLALTASAAGCSSGRPQPSAAPATTTLPPTTASTPTGPASTVPVPTSDIHASAFRVYFLRGDVLAVAGRTVPSTPAVAGAAMTALLGGPTPPEATAGLRSAIPAGSTLRSVSIKDGTATVDLSREFASGGGSLSMTARLAQVTYTLTQFPTVTGVKFRVDGTPVTVFGGEGVILPEPADRSGFESVTPAILVESPTPGATVTSPLRVWGTANVFEATFRLEVLNSSGSVVAARTVQATSGTGTRGTFDVTVPISAPPGAMTINVFDLSAKDGSRQHIVSVPVEMGDPR